MSWLPSAPHALPVSYFSGIPTQFLLLQAMGSYPLLDPQRSLSTFHWCFVIVGSSASSAFPDCTAYFTRESFLLFSIPMGEIKLLSCLEVHKTWPHCHQIFGYFVSSLTQLISSLLTMYEVSLFRLFSWGMHAVSCSPGTKCHAC